MKIIAGIIPRETCCRCEKEATHYFKKTTFFRKIQRFYCGKHSLERLEEDGIK